jgi:hypothetical protein
MAFDLKNQAHPHFYILTLYQMQENIGRRKQGAREFMRSSPGGSCRCYLGWQRRDIREQFF